jgi:hypothetical protein
MRTEYFVATRKCKTVLKLTCFKTFCCARDGCDTLLVSGIAERLYICHVGSTHKPGLAGQNHRPQRSPSIAQVCSCENLQVTLKPTSRSTNSIKWPQQPASAPRSRRRRRNFARRSNQVGIRWLVINRGKSLKIGGDSIAGKDTGDSIAGIFPAKHVWLLETFGGYMKGMVIWDIPDIHGYPAYQEVKIARWPGYRCQHILKRIQRSIRQILGWLNLNRNIYIYVII